MVDVALPSSRTSPVRFDARWAQLTETANELFAAERFVKANLHYGQALEEAETQFEAALTIGNHADDVVAMLLASAVNAARSHAVVGDKQMAFAQLERVSLVCLNAFAKVDTPIGVIHAMVAHLPRLFVELGAPKFASEATYERARNLQGRLKNASLQVIRRSAH